MSDVDWSQAPDWANYWTIDDIEFAEWHSHKPRMDLHSGSITSPNNWNLSWLNSAKYCYRAPAPRFGWPNFADRRARKRLITRPKESSNE